MDRFVPQLLYFWHDPKGLDEGFRHLGVLLVIPTTDTARSLHIVASVLSHM